MMNRIPAPPPARTTDWQSPWNAHTSFSQLHKYDPIIQSQPSPPNNRTYLEPLNYNFAAMTKHVDDRLKPLNADGFYRVTSPRAHGTLTPRLASTYTFTPYSAPHSPFLSAPTDTTAVFSRSFQVHLPQSPLSARQRYPTQAHKAYREMWTPTPKPEVMDANLTSMSHGIANPRAFAMPSEAEKQIYSKNERAFPRRKLCALTKHKEEMLRSQIDKLLK